MAVASNKNAPPSAAARRAAGDDGPDQQPVPELGKEQELTAFRDMLLIRRFEEKAGQMYGMGLIGGFCHLYIGQEAVVVGMQMSLKPGDAVITGYRDHGHMLAYGIDPKLIMAELTGRAAGISKGKGGSMHMFSVEHKFYGGHGIVGAQVPIGTGLAFAHKYNGNKNVSLTYFGDGSANDGVGVAGRATEGGTGVGGQSTGGHGFFETAGVSGDCFGPFGTGVLGTAFSEFGHGVHGKCDAGTGVFAESDTGTALFAMCGAGPKAGAASFIGRVSILGDSIVFGAKSAAVPHPDGSHRLLYSMESPESWFEDFGEAKLVKGRAKVRIDPDFAVVADTRSAHVFLTPYGDSGGLYVSARHRDGFEVCEQGRGSSSLSFSYRVVAKRKDVTAERFKKVTPPAKPKLPTRLKPPNLDRPRRKTARGAGAKSKKK
jgi:hypothetical protein